MTIGQAPDAAGDGGSLHVMLPVPVIVRLPVTLKTPSTVPSEASAAAKVVGALMVTSASFFLVLTVRAAAAAFRPVSFGASDAAGWAASARLLQIIRGKEVEDPERRDTAPAARSPAKPISHRDFA